MCYILLFLMAFFSHFEPIFLKPTLEKQFAILETLNSVPLLNRPKPLFFTCQVSNEYCNHPFINRTQIEVGIILIGITDIDTVSMKYTAHIVLNQRWLDPRLSLILPEFDGRLAVTSEKRKIWTPDTIFLNEHESSIHEISEKNQLMWADDKGMIYYTQKLSVSLNCAMDLTMFPMDVQLCDFRLSSFGYDKMFLDLRWWVNGTYDKVGDVDLTGNYHKSIKLETGKSVQEFSLVDYSAKYCKADYVITGNFSCLAGLIRFQRQYGFYIVFTYIPSILTITILWLSFLIDHKHVTTRLSVISLCVVSMMSIESAILKYLPKVSNAIAMEVWLQTCLLLVFVSMLEFTVVHLLERYKYCLMQNGTDHNLNNATYESANQYGLHSVTTDSSLQPSDAVMCNWNLFKFAQPQQIDVFFFYVYPVLFGFYNCVYWVTCSIQSWENDKTFDIIGEINYVHIT